jgi:hypothetical protein
MRVFLLIVCLSLTGAAVAATDTFLRPVRVLEVSLRNVPLEEGERIAEIEMEVRGASFSVVRLPIDWSMEVGAPVSGVAVLKGLAAHGVGMPFTTAEFQRFVTLAIYDYGQFNSPLTIKAKLVLYHHDKRTGDSERTLDLACENLALEEPNK